MAQEGNHRERGQALVEFAFAVTIFLVLLIGVVDFGRGIYIYNGVSQAAREIARVASVHPGTFLNGTYVPSSPSPLSDVIAVQQGLIPNLGSPVITCVDAVGNASTGTCSGLTGPYYVKVVVTAAFSPVSPLFTIAAMAARTVAPGVQPTWNFQSTSIVQIQ